jgi:hypothetical protein
MIPLADLIDLNHSVVHWESPAEIAQPHRRTSKQ